MSVNSIGTVVDPALLRMKDGDSLKVKFPDNPAELVKNKKLENKAPDNKSAGDVIDVFAVEMGKAVAEVNDKQLEAADVAEAFATGKKQGIHETMIALEESDISLRFLGSVRNKILESYKEVMRINV